MSKSVKFGVLKNNRSSISYKKCNIMRVLFHLPSFINSASYPANMSKDEVEGKAKKLKGQIREEVGKITGNKTEQLKGRIEKAGGTVQENMGKVTNMSDEELEGRGKNIKGRIREEIGKITDNKTEQIKGKIEQVEGKAQEEIGKVKRKAKE